MLMPDVNVLIYSSVEESSPDHLEYGRFLGNLAKGPEPFALSVLVLTGFPNPTDESTRRKYGRESRFVTAPLSMG